MAVPLSVPESPRQEAALRPVVAAVPATPLPQGHSCKSALSNRRIQLILALLAVVLVAFVAFLSVVLPRALGETPGRLSKSEARLASLEAVVLPVSGSSAFENPASPQARALKWLAFDDASQLDPETQRTWLLQRYSLAVLYFATDGTNWFNQANWLAPDHECSWKSQEKGATSCTVLRVTGIRLDSNNLQGPLPMEVGWLLDLNELILHDNQLTGSLHPTLGQLTSLQYLYLWNNSFTGTIPNSISEMGQLKILSLSKNLLEGPLIDSIGMLNLLQELHLQQNMLNGTLPTTLGKLVSLQKANLASNQFTGHIPSQLGFLKQLSRLTLHTQKTESTPGLTGTIPPELGLCDQLGTLWLDRNSLTGSLPPQLGLLYNLENLTVSRNLLTGQVPLEFSHLTNLETMWIHGNSFGGNVSFLCQLETLRELRLDCDKVECNCGACMCTNTRI